MAQVEKEKLRKKRHETLKAAAIRLIKHEVQERAKIQQSIKQRMMLQQQELIDKKNVKRWKLKYIKDDAQ